MREDEMTNTSGYTVFKYEDSSQARRGLTLAEAAQELLSADGHEYEIRQDGTLSDGSPWFVLWRTQFSRNSPLGGQPMVATRFVGETEEEIWQKVVDSSRIGGSDWNGLEAMSDRAFDAMLADLRAELDGDDKKLEPAGFIIADAAAIFGTGPTVETAWADLKNGMQTAHVPHQSDVDTEDSDCPKHWAEDQFEVLPATAALLADVEQRGGGITWSVVDGVACTEAEAG